MDYWKLTQRICLLLSLALLIAIVASLFRPLIARQKELRAREAELRQDIQKEAEQIRMLKYRGEKLQEDPRFIERIAREKLGYAKPGETVFRFEDEETP